MAEKVAMVGTLELTPGLRDSLGLRDREYVVKDPVEIVVETAVGGRLKPPQEIRERIVRCRDCKFCDIVPDGSTCFCRQFYDKPDWGLPEPYTGSEPAEMLEVSFDGFCSWGEEKGNE